MVCLPWQLQTVAHHVRLRLMDGGDCLGRQGVEMCSFGIGVFKQVILVTKRRDSFNVGNCKTQVCRAWQDIHT